MDRHTTAKRRINAVRAIDEASYATADYRTMK
jgi:hypothetical protein